MKHKLSQDKQEKKMENKNVPGFNIWNDKIKNDFSSNYMVARVAAVNKTNFNLIYEKGTITGELSGRLMYSAEDETELPATGDFVLIENFDDLAIIHEVLPRTSLLKRKSAGKKVDFQAIASNINYALIVQAIDSDFNLRRLERYLAMVFESGIIPIVVLTKTDLISDEEKKEKIVLIQNNYPDIKIFSLSNIDKSGIEEFYEFLKPGITFCLIGSSGVGKSSLINNLTESENLSTNEVRNSDKKGKHTTTRRELIVLDNDSVLIDTPGMRELANFNIDSGISETFEEIFELTSECKFSDCNHISDSGCAVIKAVEDGVISNDRYKNFIKIKKENEYYESSYLEKKRKDKEFGKMVKTVMKTKKVLKNRE